MQILLKLSRGSTSFPSFSSGNWYSRPVGTHACTGVSCGVDYAINVAPTLAAAAPAAVAQYRQLRLWRSPDVIKRLLHSVCSPVHNVPPLPPTPPLPPIAMRWLMASAGWPATTKSRQLTCLRRIRPPVKHRAPPYPCHVVVPSDDLIRTWHTDFIWYDERTCRRIRLIPFHSNDDAFPSFRCGSPPSMEPWVATHTIKDDVAFAPAADGLYLIHFVVAFPICSTSDGALRRWQSRPPWRNTVSFKLRKVSSFFRHVHAFDKLILTSTSVVYRTPGDSIRAFEIWIWNLKTIQSTVQQKLPVTRSTA